MGRRPCCDKANVTKGPWTLEEDAKLLAACTSSLISSGNRNWTVVSQRAGLKRCGKSCNLRYTNYLRPNLEGEGFTQQEEELIVALHSMLGDSIAPAQLCNCAKDNEKTIKAVEELAELQKKLEEPQGRIEQKMDEQNNLLAQILAQLKAPAATSGSALPPTLPPSTT